MNPLVTNRRVLTWLCIYPAREGTTRRQKRMFIAFSLVSATTIMWCFLSGLAFFMKYVTIDLEMALQSVFILCSAFGALYVQVVLLLSRQKIKSLFDQLTDIYDKRKRSSVTLILYFVVLSQTFLYLFMLWQVSIKLILSDSISALACSNIYGCSSPIGRTKNCEVKPIFLVSLQNFYANIQNFRERARIAEGCIVSECISNAMALSKLVKIFFNIFF